MMATLDTTATTCSHSQKTIHDCGSAGTKKRKFEETTKEEPSSTSDVGNDDDDNTDHDKVPSHRHDIGSSFKRRRQQNVRNNGRNRQQHAAGAFVVSTVVPVCSVCVVSNNNATDDDQPNKEEEHEEEDTKKEPPKYKCPKCRALYCSVVCCRKHKQICPGIPPPPQQQQQADEKKSLRTEQDSDRDNQNSSDDDDDDDDDDDESLEDGWKITDEMKHALHNSSWLRNELRNNSGLRTIMKDVVKRSKRTTQRTQLRKNNNNRFGNSHTQRPRHQYQNSDVSAHEILLDKRRNHSDFDEFCDKLLVLAGVLERQDPDNTTSGTGTESFSSSVHEMEEWLQQRKWNHPNLQPPPMLVMKPLVKKRAAIPKFEPVDVSSSSTTTDEEGDDDDDDSDTDASSTTDSNNTTGNGDS
ncbi:hypothetical protein IV203_020011 [Nitzschia inconspicua]|uniref:HIT-type domain-containing protein n=1 Tax=Nitzschia inconspicua TaxID=303405 RepID=A0A9K3Q5H2_9STRA|nr:hypothetical protein IV203_020011 [Nitzschia inconspicua]